MRSFHSRWKHILKFKKIISYFEKQKSFLKIRVDISVWAWVPRCLYLGPQLFIPSPSRPRTPVLMLESSVAMLGYLAPTSKSPAGSAVVGPRFIKVGPVTRCQCSGPRRLYPGMRLPLLCLSYQWSCSGSWRLGPRSPSIATGPELNYWIQLFSLSIEGLMGSWHGAHSMVINSLPFALIFFRSFFLFVFKK